MSGEFVVVAGEDEIEEGMIRRFVVGGEEIAIARCDGDLYAIDAICTHAHAYLSEGEVDTDMCTVECPLHGASFSLSSGRPRSLPATEPVRTFPLRVEAGQIMVAVGS